MQRTNSRRHLRNRFRSGITLVELLVVTLILLTVTAIALPTLSPSVEELAIKESSRSLTTFILAARDRAMAYGRPFGVRLESYADPEDPDKQLLQSVYRAALIEVAEPYAGDYSDSKAWLGQFHWDPSNPKPEDRGFYQLGFLGAGSGPGAAPNLVQTPIADASWNRNILVGSILHVGNGHRFEVVGYVNGGFNHGAITPNTDNLEVPYDGLDNEGEFDVMNYNPQPTLGGRHWVIKSDTFFKPLPDAALIPLDYEVQLKPKVSSVHEVEIEEGMTIDLTASGIGDSSTYADAFNPEKPDNDVYGKKTPMWVEVLFSPTGAVESVSWNGVPEGFKPFQPIYFLVGKNNLVYREGETTPLSGNPSAIKNKNDNDFTWRDLESLWISIHPLTGRVVSSPVNRVDDATVTGGTYNDQLIESRRFAKASQTIGTR
ncbi:Hypothetical protein PBC10988_28320 [Planctomycetales bacterium 10988]|nr:Hypothetical protein PBC10988_28320 [Planctomycetales bacterium 10988]